MQAAIVIEADARSIRSNGIAKPDAQAHPNAPCAIAKPTPPTSVQRRLRCKTAT